MLEWRPIDDQLPPKDGYYLVACKGGNVTDSYYIPDREEAIRYFTARGTTYYSRKHQGKYSAHFEVSHKSGYEIEYWMEIPKHPDHPPKS